MVAYTVYIPQNLQMSNVQFNEFYREFGESVQHIYELVLASHYVYAGGDGLSLLDRINRKVPRYSDNTIETAKDQIRNQNMTLMECIQQMWTSADMECYGV